MNMPTKPPLPRELPIIAIDLPVFYEDEGQEEMGETEWHALVMEIAAYALREHHRQTGAASLRVFKDLCLFYHPLDVAAYVSPDVMVCEPTDPLAGWLRSYRIGTQGPAPSLVVEVLSRRSAQQQDLTNKPELYGRLGVAEYLMLDPTGDFLPERLRLLQYEADGTWTTFRDQGQGVTSLAGFHVLVEPDGLPRFLNGNRQPYRHPSEAEPEIETLQHNLEAARQQAAELQRLLDALRGQSPASEEP